MEDYYKILGVERDADAATIKRAYRKLAMKYHPDQNPGDQVAEEKFKEAARAYEVLGNSEKRARYDRFGHAGVDGFAGGGGFHDVSDIFSAFGDIFGDFFGGAGARRPRQQRGPRRGSDLRYYLEIDLADVITGAKKEIEFETEQNCDACNGNKAEPGSSVEPCPTCGGTGQQVRTQGFFSVATPCAACEGTGERIAKPCKKCKGRGRLVSKKNLLVNVPAGVDNGTQLRLSNEGEGGYKGGPNGDLYVEIRVRPHEKFERRENHLIGDIEIDYLQALLGSEVEIETLRGPLAVTVGPGTNPGDVLKLNDQGVPSLRGGPVGDLHLLVKVQIPKKLSKTEQKLLRQIAEERGLKVPEKGGLFNW